MPHDIWTRLSEMRDASALMEIDGLVWNETTTPGIQIVWKSREEYLQKCPPGSQLVAGIGDRICGYLGFDIPTPLASNKHVYSINIAIHPDYHRQGIGGKLIDAIKQHASEQGIRKLSLRVLATNPGAIAFYKSCGFIEEGRLIGEFYLDGQYVDDLLMYYPVNN